MSLTSYLLSLVVGLAVGVAYGLLQVRSPAPPIIALLGLLGMLAGEALVSHFRGHAQALADCLHSKSFSEASAKPAEAECAPQDQKSG
ncbi:MAG: DUF1427 family protein [Pseudomonadota bacterium]